MDFEQPQKQEKSAEILEMERKIEGMHAALRSGAKKPEEFKKQYNAFFAAPEMKEYLPPKLQEDLFAVIDQAASIEDKKEFLSKMMSVLKPLVGFQENNPLLFENIQARVFMQEGKFIPLNERVCYGVYKNEAHFHLAPSFQVKKRIIPLFVDGMEKLSEVVKKNEEINLITGTSWIVATKTYGDQLKDAGFEITEVPEEIREKYFKTETRPIKMARMDREKFLKTFGVNK